MIRRRSAPRSGPGVVGTVAQTALIAGTATAVSHGVSNKMANKAQAQQPAQTVAQPQPAMQETQQQLAAVQAQQAQAAVGAAGGGTDLIGQLQQLADMKTAGLLSDAEFETAKARVLGS